MVMREQAGRSETKIANINDLIAMFSKPNKEEALKNLELMAEKLGIQKEEVPEFLEDYGDVFLSLAYFKDELEKIVPLIIDLFDSLPKMKSNYQLSQDQNFISSGAAERGVEVPEASGFRAHAGRGILGTVAGHEVRVGSFRFLEEQGVDLAGLHEAAESERSAGRTFLAVSRDGNAVGLLAVGDRLRPESPEAVARLKELGVESVLLSGDTEGAVRSAADAAGIQRMRAELLPEEKVDAVSALAPAAMVGDGLNDAPALAAADVGIAMGAGTDVAIESADVTLLKNDPRAVADAVALGRAAVRTIRWNLFWAFFYNVAAIPLAAGVFASITDWTVTPTLAAGAMALSSVTVVTNSLRLRRA